MHVERDKFLVFENSCHIFVLCPPLLQHTLALQRSTQGKSAETVVAIDAVQMSNSSVVISL